MGRSSSKEYILFDKETGDHKTFNNLIEMAEYTGCAKSNLSASVKKGTTVAKRWIVKKIVPPYEIEVYKPRIEGFDYQARRKEIIRTIKEHNTEGIVVVEESNRHNTSWWNIFMKNPSEDLIKKVNEMIV